LIYFYFYLLMLLAVAEHLIPELVREPKMAKTSIAFNLIEAIIVCIVLISYGLKTTLIAVVFNIAVYIISGLVILKLKLIKEK